MRSSVYWKSLILALLSFFSVFAGLGLLVKVIRKFNPNVRIGLETSLIGVLAGFCVVYQLLLNITGQPSYHMLSYMSSFVGLLIFITLIFKAAILRFRKDFRKYLPHASGTVGLFVVATITPFILQPLFHQPISLTNWLAALYVASSFFIFVGGFTIAAFYAVGSFSVQRHDFERSVLWGLMPLLLIPSSMIVANEIQFTLINVFGINTSPKKIYGIFIMLLLICSIFLFVIAIRRFRNTHSRPTGAKKNLFGTLRKSQLLSYCYFPILVGTAALLKYYSHHVNIHNQVDLFHWGEFVLPTHQLFNFWKVPWLDIWPTHGALDFFSGTLYSLINGASDVSTMVWWFLNLVVEYILVYLLIALVTGPLFALILTVSLPTATLFGAEWGMWLGGLTISYYCLIVLSAFFMMKSIRNPSFGNFVMFWLAVFISGLWRYDVGLTAALGGVITIGMASFFHENFRWQLLYRAVLAGAILIGSCIFLIIIITISAHHSPIDLLKQSIVFIQCQEQSQSYSMIWPQWGTLPFFLYFVCPVIPIAYIILVLLFPRSEGNVTDPLKWMLFFLAIATLVFGVRSLHRHSMIEGVWLKWPYSFIACCIPIVILWHWRATVRIGMLLTVAFIAMTGVSLNETLLPASFEFHSWKSGESRLRGNNDAQVKPLCTFLQNQLCPNETFFDFANGPLLYVYANKMFPGFLIPNLYHASETTQLYELDRLQKELAKNQLPLIIFRGHWADMDQVPDLIRNYRITEFIYKHYSPFGAIGQYQLWTANNSRFQQIKEKIEGEKTTLLPLKGDFKGHSISRSTDSERLIVNCNSDDPYFWSFLDVRHINDLSGLCPGKIRIRYRSSIDDRMQVFFGINGTNFSEKYSSWVNVTRSEIGAYKQVDVPIVADRVESFKLTDLRIDPPDDSVFELQSVETINSHDDCFEPNPRVIQNINLRRLPYVWANYDPGLRWKQTEVIKSIKVGKILGSGQPIVLDFDNCLDADHGNYLIFRVASDANAEITCMIPGKDQGKVSFQVIRGDDNAAVEYLIRVGILWNWWQNRGGKISVAVSGPVHVDEVSVRRGD